MAINCQKPLHHKTRPLLCCYFLTAPMLLTVTAVVSVSVATKQSTPKKLDYVISTSPIMWKKRWRFWITDIPVPHWRDWSVMRQNLFVPFLTRVSVYWQQKWPLRSVNNQGKGLKSLLPWMPRYNTATRRVWKRHQNQEMKIWFIALQKLSCWRKLALIR